MRKLYLLFFVIQMSLCTAAFGQNWKDSLNAARSAYQKGNYKEALKYYKSADRLAPNDVDLSQEKGQTAYKAGDFATAASCFERLTRTEKTTVKKVRAYNNLGNSRMKMNDFEGAIEAYKSALRLDPANEKARQHLAEAKRLKQQQDEAKKQKQKKQQGISDTKQQPSKGNENKRSQPNSGAQKSTTTAKQQQLKDKQTDRKLDEIARQEMSTKKRINGSKGSKNGNTVRNDW
jgi:Ca-activated chloride channel family protein